MTIAVLDPPVASVDETPTKEHARTIWRTSALRSHVVLLIAITLFGGVLRFWKLDQPALWGDEALTYSRICGTYQELIDLLQFNGFVPLHYELYHWIKQGMPVWGHFEKAPAKSVPGQL